MSTKLYPRIGKYVWDPRLSGGRWRRILSDGRLGRIVSNNEVNDAVRILAERHAKQFSLLAKDTIDGIISPAVFQETMQQTLKDLYNGLAAVGRGGWSKLTPVEWGRNGAQLRYEYERLALFVKKIVAGDYANAVEDAMARAALYIDNAYGRYWDELTDVMKANGFSFESIRTVGDDRVCPICTDAEAAGKVPIGTYRVPLHLKCRCDKEYHEHG